MANNKRYKYFLFDCDGTLVDSEIIAMSVAIDILADAVEEVKSNLKIDRPALVQEFAGWHFDKMIGEVSRRYGVKMDDAALQAKKIPQTIESLKKVQVIPGIPAYLQKLEDRNHHKAVVTSSEFSRVNPCLTLCGIDKYFTIERKFSAHDSLMPSVYKPAPDIYLHAIKSLGGTAAESVAFEDSMSGTRSARAAGIDVIGIVSATHIPVGGKDAAANALLTNGAGIVVTHADDLEAAVAWMEDPASAPAFKYKVYTPRQNGGPQLSSPAPG